MQAEAFDLNDIHNEPTDEQLQSIMEAVAAEVRRKHEDIRKRLLERIHDGMLAAAQTGTHQ
jgi:hypothetical protein